MSTKIKFDAHSIKFRLWVYFAAIGMGVVGLIWFLQLFFMNNYYEEMKIREVARVASSISVSYQKDDSNLTSSIQELSISNDFYVMMESSSGLLLFEPEQESLSPVYIYFEETPKLKSMLEKSGGKPVSFKINTGIDKYKTLAYGCRIAGSDGNAANLYIFSPLYPVSSTVSILKRQLAYVTMLTLVLAFTLAIYFANRISRPIKGITATAKEMGQGKYDVKFEGNSYSEINNLADTLNTAAYELGMADNRMKDLIANVSHDLKTPLTMIRSYAEMIQDLSGDIPEKRNAHLQVIIDETERLNHLVSDMATVSAMQTHTVTLERSIFDLTSASAAILSSYDILSEQENYNFIFNAPKECLVYGDENRIKQVIANLVNNAVKYCGEDKVIIVTIRRSGKKYRVEVADHGPGISQEELPHVWDRYYKTSTNYVRPTEGSGLGLSIVKGILTLHHANYGVYSKVGKGTTFWFELPYMRKEKDKPSSASGSDSSPSGSSAPAVSSNSHEPDTPAEPPADSAAAAASDDAAIGYGLSSAPGALHAKYADYDTAAFLHKKTSSDRASYSAVRGSTSRGTYASSISGKSVPRDPEFIEDIDETK